MIVLDTNVLSELIRPTPAPEVPAWVAARLRSDLFTTAITEAEMRYGLALLPTGGRRRALAAALERLFAEGLGGRVLPFDREAAGAYATIAADRRKVGRPVKEADMQIAAVAHSRGATAIATRNTADFEGCGVTLLNPWDA